MDEYPADHGSDRYGHVEATWRTEPPGPETVREALDYKCADCNVNVFITEDEEADGVYHLKIAHDETCPWLAKQEAEGGD